MALVVQKFFERDVERDHFSGVPVGFRAFARLEVIDSHGTADNLPVFRDSYALGKAF